MTRYYMASSNGLTVFRATATRAYTHAKIMPHTSFHSSYMPGSVPVTEITKGEYEALQALKVERQKSTGKLNSSPQESWIRDPKRLGQK